MNAPLMFLLALLLRGRRPDPRDLDSLAELLEYYEADAQA